MVHGVVRITRWKLARHMLRLPEERLASVAMNWEPVSGKRKRGRPHGKKHGRPPSRKIYKQWESLFASDHIRWKKLVSQCPRGDEMI